MNSKKDEVDLFSEDGKVTLSLKKPLKLRDYKDILMKLPVDDAIWYIKLDNDFQDSGAMPCKSYILSCCKIFIHVYTM